MFKTFAFALLIAPVSSSAAPPTDAELGAIVARNVQAFDAPGVSVVIVRDGKSVVLKGYGVRSRSTAKPVDPDTSFYIASATKAFTAAGVEIAAARGKIDIDAPAAHYLPEFATSQVPAFRAFTVRDLLSHRTGVARTDLLMFGGYPKAEILKRLATVTPRYADRSHFTYQNQMYLALGEIMARADKESWQTAIEQQVLAPLKMNDSNARGLGHPKGSDFAVPHGILSGEVRALDYVPRPPYGGGGINTTARDLGKWISFQLGDGRPLLSTAGFRAMHAPTTPIASLPFAPGAKSVAYAQGWFVHDYNGEPVIQHGGNGEGWTSLVWLEPRLRLGVGVLTNMHNTYLPWAIAFSVADRFAGVDHGWTAKLHGMEAAQRSPSLDNVHEGPTGSELKGWVGAWHNRTYGTLMITGKAARLTLTYGALSGTLIPITATKAGVRWNRTDILALAGVSPARISIDSGQPVLSLSLGGDSIEFGHAN